MFVLRGPFDLYLCALAVYSSWKKVQHGKKALLSWDLLVFAAGSKVWGSREAGVMGEGWLHPSRANSAGLRERQMLLFPWQEFDKFCNVMVLVSGVFRRALACICNRVLASVRWDVIQVIYDRRYGCPMSSRRETFCLLVCWRGYSSSSNNMLYACFCIVYTK